MDFLQNFIDWGNEEHNYRDTTQMDHQNWQQMYWHTIKKCQGSKCNDPNLAIGWTMSH